MKKRILIYDWKDESIYSPIRGYVDFDISIFIPEDIRKYSGFFMHRINGEILSDIQNYAAEKNFPVIIQGHDKKDIITIKDYLKNNEIPTQNIHFTKYYDVGFELISKFFQKEEYEK